MVKKKKNLWVLDLEAHKAEHSQGDGHNHSGQSNNYKAYVPAIISFIMLIIGFALFGTA